MKATPIAEFLARKANEGAQERPERAPNPLAARTLSAINDDREPDFRRSGLVAALARRSPETPSLVRPLNAAHLPHREAPPPRQPAAPPPPPSVDIETQLSEAYHRGVQEGIDSERGEGVTARAMERAEMQKRAVIEKLDFQMNEFFKLSETLNQGFAELERRVAQAAARLLQPLLEQSLARQIIEELTDNLSRLTRSGSLGLIKVRGPEPLLSKLKEKIEPLAVEVEYVEDQSVEITVAAQSTEISSQLEDWRRLIEEIVENG